MSSPTQRSLAELRKRGYKADIVERYNSYTKRKKDLHGCIDIHAFHPARTPRVIYVQTTSGSNVASRIAKIRALPHFPVMIAAGMVIVVHGWSKRGKAGKRKVWTLREVVVDMGPLTRDELADRAREVTG